MRKRPAKKRRPASGPRKRLPRAARDDLLLDRLEAIFLAEGFRALGVGDLAARLRCSRRTLYELAPSKQELFLLVLDRFLRRIRALGRERAAREPDLGRRVEALLEPGITETRQASEAFSADIQSSAPARRLMDDHQRQRMQLLREIVEQGSRGGVFRGLHPTLVAEVMIAAVGRVRQPDFLLDTGLTMSEAFAECSRLLRHGLLHTDGEPQRRS